MKLIVATFISLLLLAPTAQSEEVCQTVRGSVLIAQDNENTFLGRIANSYTSALFRLSIDNLLTEGG